MTRLPLVYLALTSLLAFNFVAGQAYGPTGEWGNASKTETRSLSLNADATGSFKSEHKMGICFAPLEVTIQEQFAQARGVAENCQRKGNAVAFELYCQQTAADKLRCKIRSTHLHTGNSKTGVETFTRVAAEESRDR